MKVAELREICELTLSLTQRRIDKLNRAEMLQFKTGNFASKVFAQLLHEYEHRGEELMCVGVDLSKEQDKCDAEVFYWGDNPFPGVEPGPVPPAVPKHIDQVAAELMVKQGYAFTCGGGYDPIAGFEWVITKPDIHKTAVPVQFTAPSLEGREQSDALENYLHEHEKDLLMTAKNFEALPLPGKYNGREKRLRRIEWMLEEIAKR